MYMDGHHTHFEHVKAFEPVKLKMFPLTYKDGVVKYNYPSTIEKFGSPSWNGESVQWSILELFTKQFKIQRSEFSPPVVHMMHGYSIQITAMHIRTSAENIDLKVAASLNL